MVTYIERKGLVSLLTPCYNGEKFIQRLLDSVLSQDYPDIEMVVVDDGSTDRTAGLVNSYIQRFQKRGYSLRCISKSNGGQASAINVGLPLLQGEFIAWPDSDDYYSSPHSVSSFVSGFKQSDDSVGIVRSNGINLDDLTGKIIKPDDINSYHEGYVFEDLLCGTYPLTPISYMVRASSLDKAIENRHIYNGQHPQNIQLFAPISYLFKVKNITPGLVTIVIRQDSDSHSDKNIEDQLSTVDSWIDIFNHTIDSMNMISEDKRKDYKAIIQSNYWNGKLALCLNQCDVKHAKSIVGIMSRTNITVHWKKRVKLFLLQYCPYTLRLIHK